MKNKIKRIFVKFRLVFLIVLPVVTLAAGMAAGILYTKFNTKASSPLGVSSPGLLSFLNFFGKRIPFAGLQEEGTFMISDFEKVEQFGAWQTVNAEMIPAAVQGAMRTLAARVVFRGNSEISAIMIKDLLASRSMVSDWKQFESFQFNVLNTSETNENIIVMLTDLWGNKHSETLTIPPRQWVMVQLPVSEIVAPVNPKKIDLLSISMRGIKKDTMFYFDDVRLVPAGHQLVEDEKSMAKVDRSVKMLDYGFPARKPAWSAKDPESGSDIVRVPFVIKNETSSFCHMWPVEGGVPFPMGELTSPARLCLRNIKGWDIPFQPHTLARWPDGSIKWLGLNFEATLGAGEGAGYTLEYGPKVSTKSYPSKLKVYDHNDKIIINTGVMQVVFSKEQFYLFKKIALDRDGDGRTEAPDTVLEDAPLVLTFRGSEYRADLDQKTYKIEVQEQGRQRAVLKASGWFESMDGKRFCQAVLRYYFYEGKSFIKVSHTLIYTGYPAGCFPEEEKHLDLPPNEMIDAFGLRLPVGGQMGDWEVEVGLQSALVQKFPAANMMSFFQPKYDEAVQISGGVESRPDEVYAGWVDVFNSRFGMCVAIRDFRENAPKAFRFDTQGLSIDLWPKRAGPLNLATSAVALGPGAKGKGRAFGLAKTHDLLFYFHTVDPDAAYAMNVATVFMQPLVLRNNPFWVDATGAMGRLLPVNERYNTEEVMLEKLFDWAARQSFNFGWYGMIDFGDTRTWFRNKDEANSYETFDWHPSGRYGWFNASGLGLHTGALAMYVRSGSWKYFDLARKVARHIMDIDTVHYDTVASDERLAGKINGRFSQVGSIHPDNGDHWGETGENARESNVLGLLWYAYLTGNERAMDVVKETGEFYLNEPLTDAERFDLAPQKAVANLLWGSALLYQATWDERYRQEADRMIRIFLKGQQPDGSFLNNYNPALKTWSGDKDDAVMAGVTLGAIMSYYEITQREDVKNMLLELVRYLGPNPAAMHGIAAAYFMTGDEAYAHVLHQGMDILVNQRQVSSEPVFEGLIYPEANYHSPATFLYNVPYAFEALEASKGKEARV